MWIHLRTHLSDNRTSRLGGCGGAGQVSTQVWRLWILRIRDKGADMEEGAAIQRYESFMSQLFLCQVLSIFISQHILFIQPIRIVLKCYHPMTFLGINMSSASPDKLLITWSVGTRLYNCSSAFILALLKSILCTVIKLGFLNANLSMSFFCVKSSMISYPS